MGPEDASGERTPSTFTRRATLTASAGGLLATMLSPTATAQQERREIWTVETDGPVLLSPTVVDETVFFVSGDETVFAVDANTGEQQWEFTSNTIRTSPTVANGTLFIGSEDGTLYAVDAATGEQQWKDESYRNPLTQPTVSNGTVFVGNRNGLYALDAATGEQEWSYRTFVQSSPTVANGTVFVGNWEPNIHAVDATTGERQWVFKDTDFENTASNGDLPLSPFFALAVSDDAVFGSVNATLYAIEIETGTQRWTYQTDTIFTSPIVAGDTVVVAGDKLHAVATGTGAQQWVFDPETDVRIPPPAVADGTIYMSGGSVYALNAATGDTQWTFDISDQLSSPAVADDSIVIGSEAGTLYAVDTTDAVTTDSAADSAPSFVSDAPVTVAGGAAVVGPVLGYGLYRVFGSGRETTGSSKSPSSDTPTPDTTTDDETTASARDSRSKAEDHQTAAEAAIETAVDAKSNDDFDIAAEAYSVALNEYQAALTALDSGASDKHATIEEAIESTRSELNTIESRTEQRDEVVETLEQAESRFQEAIIASAQDRQSLARIRFQQAQDAFDEAHEIVESSTDDLLTPPVNVDVQPNRELSSMTLSALPAIPESAAGALADAGIETIVDLDSSDESPWTPSVVADLAETETLSEATVTILTVASWWHDHDSYEFATAESIARRQQQAGSYSWL